MVLHPVFSPLRPPSDAVSDLPSGVVGHTPRLGIVALLLLGVRRRDVGVVVNGAISLAATAVPPALERRYGVSLRP